MTATVPASRSTRRAEQRRQRRRQQVRLLGALLGVLVLLAAGFAVYLAADTPVPPGQPPDGPSRTQRTVLFQGQGANGSGVVNALLAHDEPAKSGAVVLIAPQVLVTVPGTGSLPFGRALGTVPPQGTRNALSDLMGVIVDDGWVVDLPTFTALVDALKGVQADVDVPVVRGQNIVLQPGPQLLDGARAALFLTYLAPGELEQMRLARVQEVLDGLVNALPPTSAELVTVLGGLGRRSTTTAALPVLADFLIGLATDDQANQLQYDVLPVIDLDPGGGVIAFRADTPAVLALVDRLLAPSIPAGVRAGKNRVLVLNGVGTPGLGERVRAKLVPAGLVFVGSRNLPRFGVPKTQILVGSATPEGLALGKRVAKALGLPDAQILTQDVGTAADVVVVVGADFRP